MTSPEPVPHAALPAAFSKLVDQSRFLRQWVGNPMSIGAVAPSSDELAEAMANQLDPSQTGRVLELGPGTGVVTKAIIDRGIAPDRITSVEYCDRFADLLGRRFPAIDVRRGDAFDLHAPYWDDEPLIGIVSSLPLFTSSYAKRRALVQKAVKALVPGGAFIQFSYALVPPVRPEPGSFSVEKSKWIVRNVPPARVWTYRALPTVH
ncbi:MAG: methyltransferase domain-containing protein [Pseudomonadota bacterium]